MKAIETGITNEGNRDRGIGITVMEPIEIQLGIAIMKIWNMAIMLIFIFPLVHSLP